MLRTFLDWTLRAFVKDAFLPTADITSSVPRVGFALISKLNMRRSQQALHHAADSVHMDWHG